MQLGRLHKKFDVLQSKFGADGLNTIYGAGETHLPKVCFVFMNPTGRNVAAVFGWEGIRAPWIGTKNVWKLFSAVGLFSKELNNGIQSKKSGGWTEEFAEEAYKEIKKNKFFVTNLAKCTRKDAAHLHNSIFKEYRDLMMQEIEILNPKVIISFGNQVSSILLDKTINVSKCRKKPMELAFKNKLYEVYPVFYPVGQGMRNMKKSIEDIKYILKNL